MTWRFWTPFPRDSVSVATRRIVRVINFSHFHTHTHAARTTRAEEIICGSKVYVTRARTHNSYMHLCLTHVCDDCTHTLRATSRCTSARGSRTFGVSSVHLYILRAVPRVSAMAFLGDFVGRKLNDGWHALTCVSVCVCVIKGGQRRAVRVCHIRAIEMSLRNLVLLCIRLIDRHASNICAQYSMSIYTQCL